MNIYLMYEHLTREWVSLQRLKREFEKDKHSVYVFSIIFERSKAMRMAKKIKPDVLFVPWLGDVTHEQILYPFIKINPRVKVINLHHEEIGCLANEDIFIPKTEYARNGSFHFVWGNYFASKLIAAGIKENRVLITGNIRNDQVKHLNVTKELLSIEYGLDKTKKWILFAENRGYYVQRLSEELREEMLRRGVTEKYIRAREVYEKESLNAFIEELNHINKEFQETYEFIYRPHPGTIAPDNLPKWINIIYNRSIYDWIDNCDLFLTCGSTSIFEAEMCGKPCAIYNVIEEPELLQVVGLDKYPTLKKLEGISDEYIEELKKKGINTKCIYEDYLGIVDGKAANRIVRGVYSLMELNLDNEISSLAMNIERPIFSSQLKHQVFEYVTWFMVKTGLLYKLHYPKSAYGEAKDIPYSRDAAWTKKV